MTVVDASVAAKWYLKEPHADRALAFAASATLLQGPDILLTEVLGAIIRRVNDRQLPRDLGEALIDSWIRRWHAGYVVAHRVTAELADEAARLAVTLGHPIADCVYLALAIRLDDDLITADTRFAARAAPIYARITLLA